MDRGRRRRDRRVRPRRSWPGRRGRPGARPRAGHVSRSRVPRHPARARGGATAGCASRRRSGAESACPRRGRFRASSTSISARRSHGRRSSSSFAPTAPPRAGSWPRARFPVTRCTTPTAGSLTSRDSSDFDGWYRESFGDSTPWDDARTTAAALEAQLEEELTRVALSANAKLPRRRLEAGETLVEQGDRGADMFMLLDGDLDVEIDGATVARVGAGALLGELAVLGDGRRKATLRAVQACRVAVLPGRRDRRLAARRARARAARGGEQDLGALARPRGASGPRHGRGRVRPDG